MTRPITREVNKTRELTRIECLIRPRLFHPSYLTKKEAVLRIPMDWKWNQNRKLRN